MEAERELLHLRCAPETLAHRCFDHRRTHDIYSNAASRVFERGGLRQPHHAMLASAIRGCPSGANPTCDGGHVDDGSTTALLEHLLNFVLQAKPDAFEIDVDGAIPVFFGLLGSGAPAPLDPGVIEGNIQAAKLLP